MDKKIEINLKDGEIFITNKASYDVNVWGVSCIGYYLTAGSEEKKEAQIPWTNIKIVLKYNS